MGQVLATLLTVLLPTGIVAAVASKRRSRWHWALCPALIVPGFLVAGLLRLIGAQS
jgi:hypothetical protein